MSLRDIVGLVLRQGAMLAGADIVLGIGGAWTLAQRYENDAIRGPADQPLTLLAVLVLLILVSLIACWLPARRAARVDAITVLRYK